MQFEMNRDGLRRRTTNLVFHRISLFSSVQSSKNCVKYLIHILKFNTVLKDALRELGFVEVLIARLHHFATLLKESVQDPNGKWIYEFVFVFFL
jgi:hypothetical protein